MLWDPSEITKLTNCNNALIDMLISLLQIVNKNSELIPKKNKKKTKKEVANITITKEQFLDIVKQCKD
jgi:sorbitol-specific phosphotransferase system component IIC